MRRFVSFAPALVVLLTMVVALFAAPEAVRRINSAQTAYRIELARQQIDTDDILVRIDRATRAIAQAVEPTVVHLEARRRGGQSKGSGWVYDGKGHIVTNAHVVRDSDVVVVQFYDGRVAQATIVGEDAIADIAVLKVSDTGSLFPAVRASGEVPQQGDRVFAFGSPFGFKFSMSEGIISGLGRSPSGATGPAGFTNFIQSDAAVNPGNSGGPLVDVRGRVIGMNVAIATGRETEGTNEGQSAGISFAIPLMTIEAVVDQLISTGRVTRGYIGINYLPEQIPVVDEATGSRMVGVGINDVVEGGPAQQAGLAPRDVIVSIAGQRVSEPDVLRSVIAPVPPGATVDVTYWRDGTIHETKVTLAEFPRDTFVLQQLARIGVGLDDRPSGVYMAAPQLGWSGRGFPDYRKVESVNGVPVSTSDDVLRVLADTGFTEGRSALVIVSNSRGQQEVTLSLTP